MAGGQVVTPYDNVDVSKYIDLSRFAPKLRKLGKHLLKSDEPITIKAACDKLKLNYVSICTMIWKEKGKGNDFHGFIKNCAQSMLEANRIAVYDATIRQAVSDASTSHNDRKTYFQLTGDLKESTQINTSITLAIGMNVTA